MADNVAGRDQERHCQGTRTFAAKRDWTIGFQQAEACLMLRSETACRKGSKRASGIGRRQMHCILSTTFIHVKVEEKKHLIATPMV